MCWRRERERKRVSELGKGREHIIHIHLVHAIPCRNKYRCVRRVKSRVVKNVWEYISSLEKKARGDRAYLPAVVFLINFMLFFSFFLLLIISTFSTSRKNIKRFSFYWIIAGKSKNLFFFPNHRQKYQRILNDDDDEKMQIRERKKWKIVIYFFYNR